MIRLQNHWILILLFSVLLIPSCVLGKTVISKHHHNKYEIPDGEDINDDLLDSPVDLNNNGGSLDIISSVEGRSTLLQTMHTDQKSSPASDNKILNRKTRQLLNLDGNSDDNSDEEDNTKPLNPLGAAPAPPSPPEQTSPFGSALPQIGSPIPDVGSSIPQPGSSGIPSFGGGGIPQVPALPDASSGLKALSTVANASTGALSGLPGNVSGIAGALVDTVSDITNKLANLLVKPGELALPENYNSLVVPKPQGNNTNETSVPVLIFVNIRGVRDIDEDNEIVALDVDLTVEWKDGFLFDSAVAESNPDEPDTILNPTFLDKLWRPDVYIDEIIKVSRQSLINRPLKLKYKPATGYLSYTTRLAIQLSCDMVYIYYPADTHRCEFTFRSYSHLKTDLQMNWLDIGVYLEDAYDPNFDLTVDDLDHEDIEQAYPDRLYSNDTYDSLKFSLFMRRKLSYHMVQTYLPSIFFIIITWLCFWIPASMVEARIGISMTTLLSLTAMFASVRESTPTVSYVKAVDIWMAACIASVFLLLTEFSMMVWIRAREERQKEKMEEYRLENGDRGSYKKRKSILDHLPMEQFTRLAKFLDKFAVPIFAVGFGIFNFVYWLWLLSASKYYSWSVNSELNAELEDANHLYDGVFGSI